MMPTERRTALIRLLADIDQQIREAESLASTGTERNKNAKIPMISKIIGIRAWFQLPR